MKRPSTELTFFSRLEKKRHQKQFTDDGDKEVHRGYESYHQGAFSQAEWVDLDNAQRLNFPETHNLII